jgi:hypothetical protein
LEFLRDVERAVVEGRAEEEAESDLALDAW